MKTAVGYIRVSRERKDGISPEQQREKIVLQARLMNLNLTHIYEDLDITGKTDARPGFQKMMAAIKTGGIEYVLCYKIDRFARNVNNFHQAMSTFDSCNCSLVSISQNFDTSSPTGRLLRNILADFAQFESEMISERVRDNKVANAARGRWNGGNCPCGYEAVDKQLIPHPEESKIVQNMFELAANGHGFLSICKWLNEQGAKPRRGTVYGDVWRESTVRHMLSNRIYLGQVQYAGNVHEGCHEAIVSKDIFQEVQVQTDRRRQIQKEHRNSPHLLSGLLWCPYCKHFSLQTRYNGRNKARRHVCYTKKLKGVDACPSKNVDADGLEAAVLDAVFTLAEDKERLLLAKRGAKDSIAARIAPLLEKKPGLQLELKRIERQLRRLIHDYYDDGIISREQFTQKNQEYLEKQKAISDQLQTLEQVSASQQTIDSDFEYLEKASLYVRGTWESLPIEEQRSALRRMIRKVILYDDRAEIDFFVLTKTLPPKENQPATLIF